MRPTLTANSGMASCWDEYRFLDPPFLLFDERHLHWLNRRASAVAFLPQVWPLFDEPCVKPVHRSPLRLPAGRLFSSLLFYYESPLSIRTDDLDEEGT